MNSSSQDRIALAREILEHEAGAIQSLVESLHGELGRAFVQAVDAVLTCMPKHQCLSEKGLSEKASSSDKLPGGTARLITSGMGKAGIIAQKISATFASSGISSFFLHPAEAVHGDLGRFVESDIVLLLSNSGETAEILEMLPYVKRIGCRVLSLCGNTESSLARHSDIVLSIGDHKEAGHLGLAPTTSTAVMLALGDALAMVVQKEMNLTRKQFALYHPAGSIGRSLLEVHEIMRQGDAMCIVREESSLRSVLRSLSTTKGRPGAAVVVRSDGTLCGIFTDGDLRRLLDKNSSPLDDAVALHMGKTPKTIGPHELAQDAMHLMSKFMIDDLLVVNEKQEPIGLLDIQDILALHRK